MASETAAIPGFSEKDFYLAEFRGRAVAIALEGADEAGFEALGAVLDEFSANGTRVLVLTEDPELLEKIVPNAWISSQQFLWASALWRLFRVNFSAGLRVDAAGKGFVHACHQVVDRLQLAKLVLIEPYEALVDFGRVTAFVRRPRRTRPHARGSAFDAHRGSPTHVSRNSRHAGGGSAGDQPM